MGIWNRLLGRADLPVQAPRAATTLAGGGVLIRTPQDLEEALRSGGMTGSGVSVNAGNALRSSVAYGCIRIISGSVANLPLQIKRRVDDRTRQNATDTTIWRVLNRRPNNWMKPAQFKRMLQAHVLLRGNAYAYKSRDVRGDVQALLPLHPDRVETVQLEDNSIKHIWTRKNGKRVEFNQDEILHLFLFTLNGYTGVSPITYARESIGLALAQQDHGRAVFDNGARVGGVLRHEKSLSNEAYERLRADMEDFRSGGEREATTLILEDGMDWKPIAMNSHDAQWIESRKLSNTDIAMYYGVPPHMLGETDKSTSWGTGIDSQGQGYVTYTLEDHLTMWEEAITADCLDEKRDADLYAKFNRNALVKGDIKARWESYAKGLQWGVYSPNKVLELEDENPRDGGDIYYPPPNMTADSKGLQTDDNP